MTEPSRMHAWYRQEKSCNLCRLLLPPQRVDKFHGRRKRFTPVPHTYMRGNALCCCFVVSFVWLFARASGIGDVFRTEVVNNMGATSRHESARFVLYFSEDFQRADRARPSMIEAEKANMPGTRNTDKKESELCREGKHAARFDTLYRCMYPLLSRRRLTRPCKKSRNVLRF